jgi:hypothetical protein
MVIGYDIYDRFTMKHFSLCQSMILTTSFFFARDSIMLPLCALCWFQCRYLILTCRYHILNKIFISYIPSARQIREYSDCIRNIIARRKFHMKLSSYLKTES